MVLQKIKSWGPGPHENFRGFLAQSGGFSVGLPHFKQELLLFAKATRVRIPDLDVLRQRGCDGFGLESGNRFSMPFSRSSLRKAGAPLKKAP